MKKIFQRTHYNVLLAGACDVCKMDDWSTDFGLSGFNSNFDGGQNTSNPSDFHIMFVELKVQEDGKFGENYMVPQKIIMMEKHEGNLQNPNDRDFEFFFSHPNPASVSAEKISENWWEWMRSMQMLIPKKQIDKKTKTTLRKGLKMIKNLFGQGNYDGLWGKPSKKQLRE